MTEQDGNLYLEDRSSACCRALRWRGSLCSPRQPEANCCIYDERKKTMKKSVRYGWLAASLCGGLLVGGCSTYYKVTEPHSGNVYYTQKIDNVVGSGAVKVKDARTGSLVTLQNSEVKEISEKEYKAGLAAPVSKPAPAPAAAVVAVPAAAAASAVAPAPTSAPAPAAAPGDAPGGTK